MALWRSGYAEVCKTLYTGSIPVGASKKTTKLFFGVAFARRRLGKEQTLFTRLLAQPAPNFTYARVAELVYAFDLKSNGEIHMGSSPISGTTSGLFSKLLPAGQFFSQKNGGAYRN